jgi:uncharacterized membrane protein YgcG
VVAGEVAGEGAAAVSAVCAAAALECEIVAGTAGLVLLCMLACLNAVYMRYVAVANVCARFINIVGCAVGCLLLPAFRYGDRPGPPSREGSRGYGGSRGSGGTGAPPPPPPRGGGGYRCVLCLQESNCRHTYAGIK